MSVLEKGPGAFDSAVWLQQLKEITVRDVQLWSFFYPINFTRKWGVAGCAFHVFWP